jgi:hypothetical protein
LSETEEITLKNASRDLVLAPQDIEYIAKGFARVNLRNEVGPQSVELPTAASGHVN